MSQFDPILREMGLVPKVWDVKTRTLIDPKDSGRTVYSTMGHLTLAWVDDKGNRIAETGIADGPRVLTLVYPRPPMYAVKKASMDGKVSYLYLETTTDLLERMVKKVGAREVLRMGMAGEMWTDASILDG